LFLIGIEVGFFVGLGVMFLSSYSYKNTLVFKSEQKYRTPEKIRDKFYYIVPSEEYLEMEQAYLFKKYKEINEGEAIKFD